MNLRAIITDDEELARQNLKIQLQKVDAEIEIVGEATNGKEMLLLIDALKPDVVFLDIQMPVMTGFEAAEALLLRADDDAVSLPELIFTTAYDQYALKAFEVNAAHYLLKPITKERLKVAVGRVRERLALHAATVAADDNAHPVEPSVLKPNEAELERLMQYLRDVNHIQTEPKLSGLACKVRGKLTVIKLEEINHITADEKVNFVHTDAGEFITDYTLDDLERRLDASMFMRIHRSHLVNIKKVKTLVPWFGGKFKVILDDVRQTELSLSRFRLDEMRKRLLW
ncbi:MAG: LytTR family transcriptional regulator DNA-binding domain-containing protein [Rhizobacter sp.]|nr:LytTR family transcriptional regulator DNA-binding domain-containing protein [Chlorobiales bacterium]